MRLGLIRVLVAAGMMIAAGDPLVARAPFILDPVVRLTPSDVPPEAGRAAAISGDYIALGVPIDLWGQDEGGVYVFRRLGPTWVEVDKLTAPDGRFQDQLGFSVAMEGDVIVAGAPRYDPLPPGGGPGAVYVFRRDDGGTPDDPWDDTWPFEAKLTLAEELGKEPLSLLGYAVAISEGVIVAGRPYAYRVPGSAEVFRYVSGQWVHEDSLYPSDTAGWSVDIEGPTILMGAHGYDKNRGSGHVFEYDGSDWIKVAQILASDGNSLGEFAITANHIVAGGAGLDDMGRYTTTGTAYFFTRRCDQSWVETQKLAGSQRHAYFGQSIACDDEACLIAKNGLWGYGVWGQLFEERDGQWVETAQLAGTDHPYRVALYGPYAVIHGHVYIVRNRKSLRDFGAFQNCFGSSAESPACDAFGSTVDHDLNLQDFELFMATFGGP